MPQQGTVIPWHMTPWSMWHRDGTCRSQTSNTTCTAYLSGPVYGIAEGLRKRIWKKEVRNHLCCDSSTLAIGAIEVGSTQAHRCRLSRKNPDWPRQQACSYAAIYRSVLGHLFVDQKEEQLMKLILGAHFESLLVGRGTSSY